MGYTSTPSLFGGCGTVWMDYPSPCLLPTVCGSIGITQAEQPKIAPLPALCGATGTPQICPVAITPIPSLLGALGLPQQEQPVIAPTPSTFGAAGVPQQEPAVIAPIPAVLGAEGISQGEQPKIAPLPAMLGAVGSPSILSPVIAPIPAAFGTAGTVWQDAPIPAHIPAPIGSIGTVGQDAPVYSHIPSVFGSIGIAQQQIPLPTKIPAINGASGAVDVGSFTTYKGPFLFGAAVVIEREGSGFVPFISDYPFFNGAVGIIQQFVGGIDDTNHVTDPAWRDLDFTKWYDVDQIYKNQAHAAEVFGLDHSPTKGEHEPQKLSQMSGGTIDEESLAYTGKSIDSYVDVADGSSAAGFRVILGSTLEDGPSSNVLEHLSGFLIGGASETVSMYRVLRIFSGGNVYGTWKTWAFAAASAGDGTPPDSLPSTYDAGTVGLAWTKNHYQQLHQGNLDCWEAFLACHPQDTGLSLVSFATGLLGETYTNDILPADTTLHATVHHETLLTVALIDARLPILLHCLVWGGGVEPSGGYAGARVVIRSAFDDVNMYALVETYTAGTTNPATTWQVQTRVVQVAADTEPTYTAVNTTNPAVIEHSAAESVYDRARTNLVTQLALYQQEHDFLAGTHKVPLKRMDGFEIVYSGTVTAAPGLGQKTTIAIDTVGADHYLYFPSFVGEAGSGIVSFSIGRDSSSVLLVLETYTAGSGSFTGAVYRISDS